MLDGFGPLNYNNPLELGGAVRSIRVTGLATPSEQSTLIGPPSPQSRSSQVRETQPYFQCGGR